MYATGKDNLALLIISVLMISLLTVTTVSTTVLLKISNNFYDVLN